MRSRAAARSVAAMRPSLLQPRRRRRSHGGGAGRRRPARRRADAVYGGAAKGGDPIVVKADAKTAELRSIVDLLAPPPAATARASPARRRAHAGRARRRASHRVRASCWSRATPRAASAAPSSARSDLGDAVAAIQVVRSSGKLTAEPRRAARSPRSSRSSTRPPAPRSPPARPATLNWDADARPRASSTAARTSQGEPIVAAPRRRAHPRQRRHHRLAGAVRRRRGSLRAPDHFVNFPVKTHRPLRQPVRRRRHRRRTAASATGTTRSPDA